MNTEATADPRLGRPYIAKATHQGRFGVGGVGRIEADHDMLLAGVGGQVAGDGNGFGPGADDEDAAGADGRFSVSVPLRVYV